jgi:hypothetical protein
MVSFVSMFAGGSDGLSQLAGPAGIASRLRPSRAVSSQHMNASLPALSDEFRVMAVAEREALLAHYAECQERAERHSELAAEAQREAERYARAIREIGELLGIEEQLSIATLHDELRGERLREVATEVLWRHFSNGDVVHYKQWYDLVVAEGHRIGGKNPAATFLTQVARIETVERVGRRSGLYRLCTAA